MYVYVRSEPGLWTVGFYDPTGKWHPDRDYNSADEAAERVAWLNGSGKPEKRGESTALSLLLRQRTERGS